jgi:D-glycero-alpha-D-manno-heptose 1-phosphate guanylyltransferase
MSQWLASRRPVHAQEKIRCHMEREPLGTGGAIADALTDVTADYVLILNGDTLLLSEFLPVLKRLAEEKLDGVIIARFLEDTGRYGRLHVEDGLLKTFQEKTSGQGLINGGVYAFRTDWLKKHIGTGVSSIETDVFPKLLKEGAKIGVEVTKAPFIDIGTPETLVEASDFVMTHKDSFL